MSQKKVDAYKARKGLHNKTDRKEKVLFGLEMFAWAFICVVKSTRLTHNMKIFVLILENFNE